MVDTVEFHLNMNALLMAALTNATAIILLAQGFVLTYKTTKAPNFTLGHMMTLGAYVASASIELGVPPLMSFPVSFIIGAILMTGISLGVIEPLMRRKTSPVRITLATMGLGMVLEGLIQIFNEYLKEVFETQYFRLMHRHNDFKIAGFSGVFIVATLLMLASLILARYCKRTQIGLAMRASLVNQELAQVQGINTNRNRIILWSLAGGLSSLAGGIMVMWFHLTPSSGYWVTTSVLAAAVLGGMDSLRGAFIGGLVVGVSEIMLVTWGQAYIGVWVGEYRAFIPYLVLCLTLLLAPNGLLGKDIEEFRIRSSPLRKVRQRTLVVALMWLMLSGALIVNVSNRNKAEAREAVLEELSIFSLEERAMNSSISDFEIGNYTVFKSTVERLNITEVYISPNRGTVYYLRHNAYWTLRIRLRRVGLWDWEPR
jgi:branched-chain amino acid transport system permease protein